jgi:hypothetical protein
MLSSLGAALLASASLAVAQTAVTDPNLTGTWSTKSNSTFTGPVRLSLGTFTAHKTNIPQAFYDPTADKFTEPPHTGISYSFTDDGFYEEAYYRALANRMCSEGDQTAGCSRIGANYSIAQNPACPRAMLQWQHGTFQKFSNGSLVLTPIREDGRQLMSDPCHYDSAVFTRYNQSEMFQVRSCYTFPCANEAPLTLIYSDMNIS